MRFSTIVFISMLLGMSATSHAAPVREDIAHGLVIRDSDASDSETPSETPVSPNPNPIDLGAVTPADTTASAPIPIGAIISTSTTDTTTSGTPTDPAISTTPTDTVTSASLTGAGISVIPTEIVSLAPPFDQVISTTSTSATDTATRAAPSDPATPAIPTDSASASPTDAGTSVTPTSTIPSIPTSDAAIPAIPTDSGTSTSPTDIGTSTTPTDTTTSIPTLPVPPLSSSVTDPNSSVPVPPETAINPVTLPSASTTDSSSTSASVPILTDILNSASSTSSLSTSSLTATLTASINVLPTGATPAFSPPERPLSVVPGIPKNLAAGIAALLGLSGQLVDLYIVPSSRASAAVPPNVGGPFALPGRPLPAVAMGQGPFPIQPTTVFRLPEEPPNNSIKTDKTSLTSPIKNPGAGPALSWTGVFATGSSISSPSTPPLPEDNVVPGLKSRWNRVLYKRQY